MERRSSSGRQDPPPAPFDLADPSTYTADNLSNVPLTELLLGLNGLSRRNPLSPEDVSKIKDIVLQSMYSGLSTVRGKADVNTLRRPTMFATKDAASGFRPNFGLKRTFFPRIS